MALILSLLQQGTDLGNSPLAVGSIAGAMLASAGLFLKAISLMLTRHSEAMSEQRKSYQQAISNLTASFTDALAAERGAFERALDRIVDEFGSEVRGLKEEHRGLKEELRKLLSAPSSNGRN